MTATSEIGLEEIRARSYTVPTDEVESDGTQVWDSTAMVVVRARGAAKRGSVIPIPTRQKFFDGLPVLDNGILYPNRDLPGNGLILKEPGAAELAPCGHSDSPRPFSGRSCAARRREMVERQCGRFPDRILKNRGT